MGAHQRRFDKCSHRSYIISMRAVGVRELKNGLSRVLRRVRDGESVLVTDHGRVIAALGPPPAFAARQQESEAQALARLAQAGLVRGGEGEVESGDGPALPKPAGRLDLQRILAETRGDRFGT
jgi:prevent-host-death family protein